jgi:hypothetical protein
METRWPSGNPITNYVNQYFIEIFWTLKTLIPVILSVPILFLSLTQVVSSAISSAIPANLVAMALPASLHKPSDEGLLVYQNNTYGVYVRYPANWTSSPGEGNDNNTSVDIVTFSPSGRDQNSSSTVDLSIENVDSGESLTQYVSDSISDDKIDLNNFKVIDSTFKVTLSGMPAYSVRYLYSDQGENFKGLETGTIVGNKAYFIQYENSPAQFDRDLHVAQQMINSFKLVTK